MKIAYLIIAHNEFEVLGTLIRLLDDERNDIYVHMDKKVKFFPELHCLKAGLHVLDDRVDVRWGHVSQIECEYKLFENAHAHGGYNRYVLISGVHLPLKSQDFIHSWFRERSGYELLAPVPNNDFQTMQKMRHYNLCTRWFAQSVHAQRIWRLGMFIQRRLGVLRNKGKNYAISSNWVCLTEDGVRCVLSHKNDILREFRYSFCGDEFFVRTILERFNFADRIMETGEILFCDFNGTSTPKVLSMDDRNAMLDSGCLFARKFSAKEMDVVNSVSGILE